MTVLIIILCWIGLIILIFGAVWMCSRDMPKQEGTTATDSQTVYVPNKETMAALEATRTGDVEVFANEEEFFKSLEEDDEADLKEREKDATAEFKGLLKEYQRKCAENKELKKRIDDRRK